MIGKERICELGGAESASGLVPLPRDTIEGWRLWVHIGAFAVG